MNDPGQQPGWGYGPYAPPGESTRRPGVILWYRVFMLVMAVLYGATFGEGLSQPRTQPALVNVILVAGVVMALLYFAAAFIPVTPRGWTIGLLALGLGLFSCGLPGAVFLLVFWLRPVTKAAFQRV